jgi:hypothetical protein
MVPGQVRPIGASHGRSPAALAADAVAQNVTNFAAKVTNAVPPPPDPQDTLEGAHAGGEDAGGGEGGGGGHGFQRGTSGKDKKAG